MEVRIVKGNGEIAAVVALTYASNNEVVQRLLEGLVRLGEKIEVLKDGLFVAVLGGSKEKED